MYLHEYILVMTTVIFAFGLLIYNYARNKMSAEVIKIPHLKYKIFSITISHILINILVLFIFFAMFISIIQSVNGLTIDVVIMSFILSCFIALSFYGSGIYINSIILEEYTLPQLRRVKQFKTQFIATHLFHGLISHIMMFSGYLFAFMVLCLLEIKLGGLATKGAGGILIISGIVQGIIFATAQIKNGTAPYQLIAVIIATVLLGLYFVIYPINLFNTSLSLYFASASLSFMITMLVFIVQKIIKGRKISWDESGY